jgi:hypothetical protein
MKYDKETTELIIAGYQSGKSALDLAGEISASLGVSVPERSIIAKLASLGVYKKKVYTTKRGEVPVPKAEYIEKIAKLLNTDSEFLESLEKVNKAVLALIFTKLSDPKLD